MKLKERFPVIVWILQRSVFYYAIATLIVMGSVEFYLWDYLRLKQLQQLFMTSAEKDPYSAVRYYEHLSAMGAADSRIYLKLSESYLLIGDIRGAQKAYLQAIKRVSPESKEYSPLLEAYAQIFKTEGQ